MVLEQMTDLSFCLEGNQYPDQGEPGTCFYNSEMDWYNLQLDTGYQTLKSKVNGGPDYKYRYNGTSLPSIQQAALRDNVNKIVVPPNLIVDIFENEDCFTGGTRIVGEYASQIQGVTGDYIGEDNSIGDIKCVRVQESISWDSFVSQCGSGQLPSSMCGQFAPDPPPPDNGNGGDDTVYPDRIWIQVVGGILLFIILALVAYAYYKAYVNYKKKRDYLNRKYPKRPQELGYIKTDQPAPPTGYLGSNISPPVMAGAAGPAASLSQNPNVRISDPSYPYFPINPITPSAPPMTPAVTPSAPPMTPSVTPSAPPITPAVPVAHRRSPLDIPPPIPTSSRPPRLDEPVMQRTAMPSVYENTPPKLPPRDIPKRSPSRDFMPPPDEPEVIQASRSPFPSREVLGNPSPVNPALMSSETTIRGIDTF